jgi:sulfotransferase
MKKQFVCLSGLPRAGSTLLSAILCQNPDIHAEGNSAVCQLMWDMQESCTKKAREQLSANNRQNTAYDLISEIPNIYYKNTTSSVIVDKCRSWTVPANIELLKKYIDKDYKVIVLERSVTDVIKSFMKINQDNGIQFDAEKMLTNNTEPVMTPLSGILYAKKNNDNNNFLFISYNELVNDTKNTIQKIYDFCGWKHFEHDFNNIVQKFPENDEVYGMKGLHEIRNTVGKRDVNVTLPDNIATKCMTIDKLMGYA